MNKCEKCGFLHYRTDPCRGPKRSTAARKDVRSSPSVSPTREAEGAGTQALPVDTNSISAKSEETKLPASQVTVCSTSAGTVGNKDRQTKFDKKAWMREYMREHRRGIRRRVAN